MINVPAIDGITQARRYAEAEQMARELIAVTIGQPSDTINVDVHLGSIAGTPIDELMARIDEDRATLALVQDRLNTETISIAAKLASADVPLRDIGGILGLSFQRAGQLIAKAEG